MYTLTLLDYTAELIEPTYDLGALTRRYAVPAVIAIYVAMDIAYNYFQALRGPSRAQMIAALTEEWKSIVSADPDGDLSESIEFVWFLASLTDDELVIEYRGL